MFLPEDRSSSGMMLKNAVAATEREIFAEAMGIQEEDLPGHVSDDFDRELEETEGWDGDSLSDQEQLANAMDPLDTGYDRPLALQRDLDLLAENERLRQERDHWQREADFLMTLPGNVAVQQQQREALKDELLTKALDTTPGGGNEQLLNALQAANNRINDVESGRATRSFEEAHRRYGDDFLDVAQAFEQMNFGDPLARQIHQSVMASSNPGEALMNLHGNDLLNMLHRPGAQSTVRSQRQAPPFMAARRAERSARRGGNLTYDDIEHLNSSGYGSEADIFNDAIGDSRDNAYWRDYGG